MNKKIVFKRTELKYIITQAEKEEILNKGKDYLVKDYYAHSTIRNIYYDTLDYRLIRHSIEKPTYKEKLRVRSYKKADEDSIVFVEIKKKYKSIVYKRRMPISLNRADKWLIDRVLDENSQIAKEVDYMLDFYKDLKPMAFISYERDSYKAIDDEDFRITFDDSILYRDHDLSLKSELYGSPLLQRGDILMEVKCNGAIPLWMVEILSKDHIYKTSFSKYGMAYKNIIFPKLESERNNG